MFQRVEGPLRYSCKTKGLFCKTAPTIPSLPFSLPRRRRSPPLPPRVAAAPRLLAQIDGRWELRRRILFVLAAERVPGRPRRPAIVAAVPADGSRAQAPLPPPIPPRRRSDQIKARATSATLPFSSTCRACREALSAQFGVLFLAASRRSRRTIRPPATSCGLQDQSVVFLATCVSSWTSPPCSCCILPVSPSPHPGGAAAQRPSFLSAVDHGCRACAAVRRRPLFHPVQRRRFSRPVDHDGRARAACPLFPPPQQRHRGRARSAAAVGTTGPSRAVARAAGSLPDGQDVDWIDR